MNFKNYKKYIIVDRDNRPMAFDTNQLCYCTHYGRSPFPVQTYTYEKAMELIRKTIAYRNRKRMEIGYYNLMPVAPKITLTEREKER